MFGWLAFPAAGDSALLRNLNGSFVACCTPEQQPAAAMMAGSGVLAGIVVVGAALGVAHGGGRVASLVALIATLLSASTGATATVLLVDETPSLLAVADRSDKTICETRRDLTVCVWPEQDENLDNVIDVLGDARERLRLVGVETPGTYSESPRSDASTIQVANLGTDADLRYTFVQGLLPNIRNCRSSAEFNVYAAYDDAVAWLARTAGLTESELAVRVPPHSVKVIKEITAQDSSRQLRWYQARRAGLQRSCGQ